ncbi:MAG: hypothetical protein P8X69_12150 [Maritimibacter sp.]
MLADIVAQKQDPGGIAGADADALFQLGALPPNRFQRIIIEPLHKQGILVKRFSIRG